MNYEKYIVSSEWRAKRKERLGIDNSRCAVCWSKEKLEVHHLTYENLGNEDVWNDLLTLCVKHHDIETDAHRRRKYSKKEYKVDSVKSNLMRTEEILYGMEGTAVQASIYKPVFDALRNDCGPTSSVDESIESHYLKKKEGGR